LPACLAPAPGSPASSGGSQLARSTWQQALADVLAVSPSRPDDHPGHAAVEIAIYPDVAWLAVCSLRSCNAGYPSAV